MKEVPIWEKSNLTLEEAAAYSGIGINKLRTLNDSLSGANWMNIQKKCFHFKAKMLSK